MEFTQKALELEKHRAYLNEISKEDITHLIKSVIYHLEQKIIRAVFLFFLSCMISLVPKAFFKRLDWIYSYKG